MTEMELGNAIFGNSRGDVSIPRTSVWEGPWEAFCEEFHIDSYGFPEDACPLPKNTDGFIETETFRVRPYDWDAHCDCGAEEKMEAWFSSHAHASDCYQNALKDALEIYDTKTGFKQIEARAFGDEKSVFSGFEVESENPAEGMTVMTMTPRTDDAMAAWRGASGKRRQYETKLYEALTKKFNLPMQGCAVHCTCTHDRDADIFWNEIGGHKENCRLTQPNFLFKPTGFRVNWYKYPFRDSYMTPGISAKEWQQILRQCAESVA